MTSVLPVDKIKTDGGTQSRATINDDVVAEYAAVIRDGEDFPPVTVFYDGKRYWLADGFHRLAAYRKAGAVELPVAVHQGTKRDAVLFSVGANAAHGLRRTNDDKRRAVMVLLSDKEWSQWSDREIARQCGVGRDLVGDVRRSLSPADSEERTYTTKHGTTATMDTAKIGKRPEASQSPDEGAAGFDLYAINGQDRSKAEKDHERQRAEIASQLPSEIQAMEAAKVERRAAKAGGHDDLDALTAERDELRDANAALEADLAEARRQVAKYDDMAVQFEQGGFDKVIAGKDEEIRVLESRLYSTNRDMASWMKKAKWEEKEKLRYKAEAEKRGYSDDIDMDDIDPGTGEVIDG